MIRSSKSERDEAIEKLYYDSDLQAMVRSYLLKNGGSLHDFDIIYNTAIMQFVKTVIRKKDFEIISSLNSYIVGIAKYSWYKEIKTRKKLNYVSIEEFFDIKTETTPESLVIDHDKKKSIGKLLDLVGEKCKSVLMYWANGYTMKEIAELVGYKSEGMAKKKKHLCLKDLLLYVDENPNIKDVLR